MMKYETQNFSVMNYEAWNFGNDDSYNPYSLQ